MQAGASPPQTQDPMTAQPRAAILPQPHAPHHRGTAPPSQCLDHSASTAVPRQQCLDRSASTARQRFDRTEALRPHGSPSTARQPFDRNSSAAAPIGGPFDRSPSIAIPRPQRHSAGLFPQLVSETEEAAARRQATHPTLSRPSPKTTRPDPSPTTTRPDPSPKTTRPDPSPEQLASTWRRPPSPHAALPLPPPASLTTTTVPAGSTPPTPTLLRAPVQAQHPDAPVGGRGGSCSARGRR